MKLKSPTYLQVDVVYIGNLNVQHMETVMMMFGAGKPVLCEKPLTTSMKNVTAMIQVAKEKDLFLMEVHCMHSPG